MPDKQPTEQQLLAAGRRAYDLARMGELPAVLLPPPEHHLATDPVVQAWLSGVDAVVQWITFYAMQCPKCSGHGDIFEARDDEGPEYYPCDWCSGTGKVTEPNDGTIDRSPPVPPGPDQDGL